MELSLFWRMEFEAALGLKEAISIFPWHTKGRNTFPSLCDFCFMTHTFPINP